MISHALYDAWRITPPCELIERECQIECPYHYECFGNEPDDDECSGDEPDDDECFTITGADIMTVQELIEHYKNSLNTTSKEALQ